MRLLNRNLQRKGRKRRKEKPQKKPDWDRVVDEQGTSFMRPLNRKSSTQRTRKKKTKGAKETGVEGSPNDKAKMLCSLI
jgi:hypothetical protein